MTPKSFFLSLLCLLKCRPVAPVATTSLRRVELPPSTVHVQPSPPPKIETGLIIGGATIGSVAIIGGGLFAYLWKQARDAEPTFREVEAASRANSMLNEPMDYF